MNTGKKPVEIGKTIVLLLGVILFAAALFLLCYHYDNKYTVTSPQPMNGVLMLDTQDLEQYPVIYLIRDWEIYRERLLAPEDFISGTELPDEFAFIGQYGSFEGRADQEGNTGSPHGSVTYRLNIALPAETKSYALELPEIYSAYKLYINGVLMAQMGDPNPQSYRAETGNRLIMVQAENRMEILVAVSDYSHFYSGMVYPPAFGEPEAVQSLLNTRLTLRAAVMAVALCVGLLYCCLWFFTKRDKENILPLLYSALCVCFVLYTCYPVIKTLWPGGMGFYAVENFAYCVMFLLVMLIQRRLTDAVQVVSKPFVAFGIFVCSSALLVPFMIKGNLTLILAYSGLIGAYAWICAAFLTISAGYGVWRGKVYSKAMLAGVIVFDTALVMDRLLPMFEPIRFGWFIELAGGVLVLLIGMIMAMEVARQFRQRQAMEFEVVESRIDIMLSQIQPHFLYNTLTTIENLCHQDGAQAAKLVRKFSNYLRDNMDALKQKELVSFDRELEHMQIYLEIEKIRFEERLNVVFDFETTDFFLPILTVQPLVENAVRYGVTKKMTGGTVTISTRREPDCFKIIVADNGVGFDPTADPGPATLPMAAKQFNRDRRSHVGIENVRNRLRTQCGGMLSIESAKGIGTTATITIPGKERTHA